MEKIIILVMLLPFLCCTSLKIENNASKTNTPHFINNVPIDGDNIFIVVKVNKYSNLEQNKNWAFYNDLPMEIGKKIRDHVEVGFSTVSEEGFRVSLDLRFSIIPDYLWIEKNVVLIEDFWDKKTLIYYSLFKIKKSKFEELQNSDLVYRPVIRNFSMSDLRRDIDLSIAWELGYKIPNNSKIAVVNFVYDDKSISEHFIEEITTGLIEFSSNNLNKNFKFFERRAINAVRTEQNFQLSGEVNDNAIISIGKFLGADVIITGGIYGSGRLKRFCLKAIDVKTTRILSQISHRIID